MPVCLLTQFLKGSHGGGSLLQLCKSCGCSSAGGCKHGHRMCLFFFFEKGVVANAEKDLM